MAESSTSPRDSAPSLNEKTPTASPFDTDVERGTTARSEDATIVDSERGFSRGKDDSSFYAAEPDRISEEKEEQDPNIVDWDGPTDPENPMNWTDKKKWANIAVLSIMTLVTYAPLSS